MSEYAWFDNGRGRSVYRRVRNEAPPARSELPCPMVVSDAIEIRSMADGKIYTSKAALRASYLPSGNPSGERFIEIGNEALTPPPPPKPDRKAIRDSVGKALNRVGVSV